MSPLHPRVPPSSIRLGAYLLGFGVEVFTFIGRYFDQNHLCVRLTAQIFNDVSDAEVLADAVLGLRGNYSNLPEVPEVSGSIVENPVVASFFATKGRA